MKKLILLMGLIAFPLSSYACGPGEHPPWTLTEGLAQPESALYDPRLETIFVSNLNGDGQAKDGNGYISKVNSRGRMIQAKWVDGLDAPKGLGLRGTELWIADINQLVVVDTDKGSILKRIPIEGSRFLNDITVDWDGTLFVSDMLGSAIHRVPPGSYTPELFVSGEKWESPNGLFVVEGKLYVAAWGYVTDLSKPQKTAGNFYSIDLLSKEKKILSKKPVGNLDGLWMHPRSRNFYVSDWVSGKVFTLTKKGWQGNVKGARGNKNLNSQGTADLSLMGHLLLVPNMMNGTLDAVNSNVF